MEGLYFVVEMQAPHPELAEEVDYYACLIQVLWVMTVKLLTQSRMLALHWAILGIPALPRASEVLLEFQWAEVRMMVVLWRTFHRPIRIQHLETSEQ